MLTEETLRRLEEWHDDDSLVDSTVRTLIDDIRTLQQQNALLIEAFERMRIDGLNTLNRSIQSIIKGESHDS